MVERSYAFCYIVLNGGAYLDYSLASIMQLVKHNPRSGVVIVEAADQFSHPLEKTSDGLSIDGTQEIIEKWVSRYPERILYSRLGNIQDKRESRNKCLDLVRNNLQADYIFNVDGDELILETDFFTLDKIIANNPDKVSFWMKQFLFWGDFTQKYTNDFAGYKELVFRNGHNIYYGWWHTQISISKSPPVVKFMPNAVIRVEVPYYHYGHIYNDKRVWMRRLYSYTQNQWFYYNIEPTRFWNPEADYWDGFFTGEPWEDKHWAEVEPFPLESHPEIIKSHPWFNMSKQEIWDTKHPYPTFQINE